MITATEAIQHVQTQAERIKNDAPQRFPDAASPGETWRQGDVYITLLEAVPAGAVESEASAQVAIGDTTGSRHCLDSLECVRMFRPPNAGQLDGPIIQIDRERTITHPEHGDVILPAGIYRIHYQRDLDAEEREQRVMD